MGCHYYRKNDLEYYNESDEQIKGALTITQLINVMENKLNRCIREK